MVVNPKLTWPGGLTVEFLGVYRAFIAGDASLAQVLNTKAALRRRSDALQLLTHLAHWPDGHRRLVHGAPHGD